VRQHRLLSGAGRPRGVMLCGPCSRVSFAAVMLCSRNQQLTERHARSATQVHQVGQQIHHGGGGRFFIGIEAGAAGKGDERGGTPSSFWCARQARSANVIVSSAIRKVVVFCIMYSSQSG